MARKVSPERIRIVRLDGRDACAGKADADEIGSASGRSSSGRHIVTGLARRRKRTAEAP